MTHIEFFDKNFTENICACLTIIPERVILIGDNYKKICKHAEIYEEIFLSRGYEVEVIPMSIGRNNIVRIIEALSKIVETYPDCVFDVTGGEDLYLVATGIVCEKYKEKNIQIHRFNIENNMIYDCDMGESEKARNAPVLSAYENIKIFGGQILYAPGIKNGTYIWDLNEEFKKDIETMWSICKSCDTWNKEINALNCADECKCEDANSLMIHSQVGKVKKTLKKNKESKEYIANGNAVKALIKAGFITEYECDDKWMRVVFKNEQIKKCLTKAGQVLEMKVYLYALEAKQEDGVTPLYNDVVNGVYIDWDGKIADNRIDTSNEIDVMLMCGMIPVFISCKNGRVTNDELYKLNTVATRFGGKYAKKVIVISHINIEDGNTKYLLQRAVDMGIHPIVNFKDMDESEIRKEFKKFCLLQS